MIRDTLSKREDRALHRALASIVLTQYPNPERKDCPGTRVLRSIATKSIAMRDPVHEHVGRCSPCFSELTEIRQALHRRNLTWSLGTAGAAVLVLAVVAYFAFLRVDNPVRLEAVQPGVPAGTLPAGNPNSTSPTQAEHELALLDLRNASATRTVQPSAPTPNVRPAEIARGLLAVTVQLPLGSEAGSYEVQLRDPALSTLVLSMGVAHVENGITKLTVYIDTRSIPSGKYEFGWRPIGFDWRFYPLLIR
jgi:hypothetical protein